MADDEHRYLSFTRDGVRVAPAGTKADLWGCVRLSAFIAALPDKLPFVSMTTCARCGVAIVYNPDETGSVNRDATKVCVGCMLIALEKY
jgi:hypothetical protein